MATDTVPVVHPDLFTTDPPQLLGGQCEVCTQVFFPSAPTCAFCRSTEVSVRPLATSGTIYSFTIVRIPVPGYRGPVPYGLGLVELSDGIRVTSTLTARDLDDLVIGADVSFRLVDVGPDDDTVLSYAYEVVAS